MKNELRSICLWLMEPYSFLYPVTLLLHATVVVKCKEFFRKRYISM